MDSQETKHLYVKKNKTAVYRTITFILVIMMLSIALVTALFYKNLIPFQKNGIFTSSPKNLEKFSSQEDFLSYLQSANTNKGSFLTTEPSLLTAELSQKTSVSSQERYSQTNVQVKNIDEPDIVKTDGTKIYFSNEPSFQILPTLRGQIPEKDIQTMPFQPQIKTLTKIIQAFPPQDLSQNSTIQKSGNLLLAGDVLVIFSNNSITAYNISIPTNPQEIWSLNLDESSVKTARLKNEKIYIITRTLINQAHPCPMPLVEKNGRTTNVECAEIYHPIYPTPTDTVYTAFSLNSQTGQIENKISFVGSTSSSVTYMSENFLYITYTRENSTPDTYLTFLENQATDLLPINIITKLQKLANYDLSPQTKLMEIEILLANYKATLPKDERLRVETELQNRLTTYFNSKIRELETTEIVKVDPLKMEISVIGSVPGHPLNQFSLDEHEGFLRIATTSGGPRTLIPTTSANDIYVLDKNLKVAGSLLNLGLKEKIYSTRFIKDKGYLVTFKETDPFYVLNLADPKNPTLSGELKIPGFSSYLHPLTDNLILGIGKENQSVKLSLFDVSSPNNPKEISKYTLNEYWSESINNHHAFLQDPEHKVFFIPASQGGYMFSYENNTLTLKYSAANSQIKRGLYIGNYFYLLASNEIIALDENTWDVMQTLDLTKQSNE